MSASAPVAREGKRITPIQLVGIPAILCLIVVLLTSIFQSNAPNAPRPASILSSSGSVTDATGQNPVAQAPSATSQTASGGATEGSGASTAATRVPSGSTHVSAAGAPAVSSVSPEKLQAVTGSPVLPPQPGGQTQDPNSSSSTPHLAPNAAPSPSGFIPTASGGGLALHASNQSSVPQVTGVPSSTSMPTATTPAATLAAGPRTAASAPSTTTDSTSSSGSVLSGESLGLAPGITTAQAATAIATGQPVSGASTQGSTAASALPNTNALTYAPPAGDPMSAAYWGLGVYPSSQPPPANWTPLVNNAYQVLPLSAAPNGYGPGNPFYGNGSAPWIDGNANDGTRDPITGQVWYPGTQAGGPTSPGWKYSAYGG